MNYLEMSLQQSIVTLRSHGWSFRRIARELGIRRETVSKYVREQESISKPAKVPTGSEGATEPKPANLPAGSPVRVGDCTAAAMASLGWRGYGLATGLACHQHPV